MRKLLFSLLMLAALCGQVLAQSVVLPGFPPGVFQDRGALDGAAASGFQGAGDTVSGAIAWGSCARAYNAAYATAQSPLCDIVDTATGLATCTLSVGTSGFANLTALSCASGTLSVTTFCTVTHAAGCSVTKIYDQTGGTACGGACFWANATLAQMPTLALSGLNSLPCMSFVAASSTNMKTNGLGSTIAQPFSISAVAERTANIAYGNVLGDDANWGILFSNNSGHIAMFAGGTPSAVASESTFHGIQAGAGPTSTGFINIDGVATTGLDAGGNSASGNIFYGSGNNFPTTGMICEAGLWPIGFNSTQQTNLFNNQNGPSGYNGAL